MKKFIVTVLCLLMCFSLFSCGESKPETKATEKETTEAPTESELDKLQKKYDLIPCRREEGINYYNDKIDEIEAKGIKQGGIVFYGSSGFTRWNAANGHTPLEEAVTAKDGSQICLNHGFGGSTCHELCFYYERMVKAYKPKALVISSMINDPGFGYTNDEMMTCVEYLCERARTDMPGIHIYLTDVRPTAKEITDAAYFSKSDMNAKVKKYCDAHDDVTLVELSKEQMYYLDEKSVGTYRNINTSIFIEDMVHYTTEGYHLFAEVWKRVLDADL